MSDLFMWNSNPQKSAGDAMRKTLLFIVLIGFVGLAAWGCAKSPKTEENPFFDEWQQRAAESQGYSPQEELEAIDVAEFIEELEPVVEEVPEPPLPTTRVSLQLRDVPIAALLQALSKAADQNIVFSSAIQKNVSINLSNVAWDQAFRSILSSHGLIYAWEGDILRVMTVEDMEHELKVARVRKERAEEDRQIQRAAPLTARILRVSYADPELLRENLLNLITTDAEGESHGSIVVDKHSNSLVVKATREDQERVLNMVRHLDKPRSQVLIKATIVEATQETARDLGIQWGGRRTGFAGNQPWMISPGVGGPSPSPQGAWPSGAWPVLDPVTGTRWPTGNPPPPVFDVGQGSAGMAGNFPANLTESLTGLSLGFIVGGANYLEVQLSALQDDGKLNILSSPSITTLDNQLAYTENGEKVPFVTFDSDGDKIVRFEDAVLRLEITPNTIGANLLKMKINVKKDEVDFTRQVDGNPLIIKKQTETNLIVENGETIVISGLTKQRDLLNDSGVPGLKDLQGLGWLFKRENKGSIMEEVLIFITPTILPPRALNQKVPDNADSGS